MKLFRNVLSISKDFFSSKALAKKLIATGVATAIMTAIGFLFATQKSKHLIHIPDATDIAAEVEGGVGALPLGLTRERADFEKAISILAESKDKNDFLEDYFERVSKRVKGEAMFAEKGSGVRVVKPRRVTQLAAAESKQDKSAETMKGYAESSMVAGSEGSTAKAAQASEPTNNEPEMLVVGDMAFETNPAIEKWVNWYTNTQTGRATMTVGLRRSQAYIDIAREEFRRAGVPEDLIWLALVESVWNPTAVSPASAGGIWQFIPKTAKEYGLTVEQGNDERTDPRKQTRVAAEYLRDLYTIFGDWALAMAAYNTGEPRVMDGIVKNGRANFWDLYEKQLIPKETRDYVPKILAAIKVVSEAELYGFATGPASKTEVTFGGR